MIKDFITIVDKGSEDPCNHSFFEVEFGDGSKASEKEVNWSSFSEEKDVSFNGQNKKVYICSHPVKSIKAFHKDMKSSLKVPKGHQVYQMYVGEARFSARNQEVTNELIGKVIGIVKDGVVVEEHFLDGRDQKVNKIKCRQ